MRIYIIGNDGITLCRAAPASSSTAARPRSDAPGLGPSFKLTSQAVSAAGSEQPSGT